MEVDKKEVDPIRLFGDFMKVSGVPSLDFEDAPDQRLKGKKLGVINGGSWTSLWSSWFGKQLLPGVKIINVGNEAVQLNFMQAHKKGDPCPPQSNIDIFERYAHELYDLFKVDAILISCSTMNKAYQQVKESLAPLKVPVIQIDQAMMERAVQADGKILVIATHGPTVKNTQTLLSETAERLGRDIRFTGATVEEAFELLGEGKIREHNEVIAQVIREATKAEKIGVVVLAQLSMSVFKFSFPDTQKEFGVDVLTSGELGFLNAKEVLLG